MTNVETIKDLIIRFGEPWNEHHRDDLGIEYAERIISLYDREGLTYYFQRCREWVSVQTIFIDLDGTVMVSCFSNITEESNEDWMDGADFCIDKFEDFARIEQEVIINKIKKSYGQP